MVIVSGKSNIFFLIFLNLVERWRFTLSPRDAMHCVKPQHFPPKCFEKIRQSEVSLGGLLSRPEVRSSLYVNSEDATFIKEETFTSYSEYFVESLR